MAQPNPSQHPPASATRRARTEDPFQLSQQAMELAQRYHTPPDPDIYNVWYAYAAGAHPALNTKLDRMLEHGVNPSTYDLSELNREVLLAEDEVHNAQQSANESLQAEMEEVQSFIRSYLDSTERYQGAIDTSTRTLSTASTPDEMEMMVALVIRENQRIRAQTQQLSESLLETQGEIVQLQEKLEESRQAEMKDPMTGLPNRRFFQRAFEAEFTAARHDRQPMCFALADIDHFKSVNDRFGHQIGDEVLKFVGGYLQDALDQYGSVSRYGGEEFAIILPGMEIEPAFNLLDDVRQGLSEARLVTSKSRKPIGAITISIGVAAQNAKDTTSTLFERTDDYLYRAKANGRNRAMSAIAA